MKLRTKRGFTIVEMLMVIAVLAVLTGIVATAATSVIRKSRERKTEALRAALQTGKKETDKVYTRYTGYPGGQRFNTPAQLRQRKDGIDKILRHAVKGMLPKGPLGRSLMNNLYIYEGTEHPHEAQKPKTIDINQYK